jgi:hypothetical protein
MPLPIDIDTEAILNDLNLWGWRDFKIETVCGFTSGYVSQIRCGNIKTLGFPRAARLYNFWESERDSQALQNQAQISAEATT